MQPYAREFLQAVEMIGGALRVGGGLNNALVGLVATSP